MENLKTLLPDGRELSGKIALGRAKGKGSRRIGWQARELMGKLDAPESSFNFFCYALHNLPLQTVEKCAAAARELGTNKGAYFNKCVRNEIAARKK